MNLARLDPRLIDSAGVLLAAGMTVLVGWLGVAPGVQQRAQSETLRRELEERQTEAGALAAGLAAASAAERRARERLNAFDVTLSTPDQLNRVLRDVNVLAETSGVTVASLLPGEATRADPVGKVHIRIEGAATPLAIGEFVSALCAQFPDIRAQSLRLGASADGDATRFDADLIWFVQPTTASAAPATPRS